MTRSVFGYSYNSSNDKHKSGIGLEVVVLMYAIAHADRHEFPLIVFSALRARKKHFMINGLLTSAPYYPQTNFNFNPFSHPSPIATPALRITLIPLSRHCGATTDVIVKHLFCIIFW